MVNVRSPARSRQIGMILMSKMLIFTVIVGGIGVFGHATFAQGPQEDGAEATSEAEVPKEIEKDQGIDGVCFRRGITRFRLIEGEDNVVLLRRRVKNWYRVELVGVGCTYKRLRLAQSLKVQSPRIGGCLRTGDTLVFSYSAFGQSPGGIATNKRCSILDIEEIDGEEID